MKRTIALLLALTLLLGILMLPASAADDSEAVNVVRALGIMIGNQDGDMNLNANVTRAEFSKMIVAASSYKDTVGGASGYSLFKDVKKDHWAVEYIKVAAENSWILGYLDGTFRPTKSITLEETASVVLRLLGYESSDLAGSYPTAQLSKFNALGLHDGFSTSRGEAMTRGDCAQLFYNLMAAKTKDGMIYAQTLGYALDATGHVDYASLVSSNTSGPFTLAGGSIEGGIPFNTNGITVYRNNAPSTLAAATTNDIYYYNQNLRTVWIYSNRVTGTYTAASPSATAPSAVTVAGVTYEIEASNASYKLSTQGSYSIGDTVTLLLGMNGGVADVCDAGAASGIYYGIVTDSKSQSITAANGTTTVGYTISVRCTDGVTRAFENGTTKLSNGTLVEVNHANSTPVSSAKSASTSGKIASDAKSFGSLKFASDVEILDTDQYGNALRIYPARLSGSSLSSSNVKFYALNAAGEISHMILRDATGDTALYGVISEAQEATGMVISSSYTFLMGGTEMTIGSKNSAYNATKGAARVIFDGEELASVKNLEKVTLSSLSATTARGSNKTFAVSENVQVYILKGGDYFATTLSAVTDTSKYTLQGCYDNLGYPAGGQIRIVIASEK